MRGTFAAWNIVEWHTFWRGEDAFQLASVVSSNFRVPIEYATADMQATMRTLFALGSAMGAWFIVALMVMVGVGMRWRWQNGASAKRAAIEIIALIAVNAIVLYLLAMLLALPASLTTKVDFRTTDDIHTNSLVWSSVNVLPVAPVLAVIFLFGQVAVMIVSLRPFDRAPKPR